MKGKKKMLCEKNSPIEIHKTCTEWFDGTDTAMYAVMCSKPFDPIKLEKEANDCLRSLMPKFEKERPRLIAVRDWAHECSEFQRLEADVKKLLAKYPNVDRTAIKRYVDTV
jgi:hypothetical protein